MSRHKTNFSLKDEPINTNYFHERLDSMGKNLETTMMRTHLSCGLILKKNECMHNLSVRDVMSGKRKYLTSALEDSRKILRPFKLTLPFARGKRKSLAEKIKESQNRLQILRCQSEILTKDKPFTKKRRSLVTELEKSRELKQHLMCNQATLKTQRKVPGLPPIDAPIDSTAHRA